MSAQQILPRMGTVDTLNGLLATLYILQREKTESENVGFTPLTICNTLYTLRNDSRYHEALKYIDFRRCGENSYSSTLERYFFSGEVWGFFRRQGRFGELLYITEKESQRTLHELQEKHGEEVLFLHELALAFLDYMPGSS